MPLTIFNINNYIIEVRGMYKTRRRVVFYQTIFLNPFVLDGSPLCIFVHRVGMVGPVNSFQIIMTCLPIDLYCWLSTDSSIKMNCCIVYTIFYGELYSKTYFISRAYHYIS